jgi:hypothetical protein
MSVQIQFMAKKLANRAQIRGEMIKDGKDKIDIVA